MCRACGTAHHELCWRTASGCGSYDCAPARRLSPGKGPALKISPLDLEDTAPLPVAAMPRPHPGVWVPPPPGPRRTSRLAVFALVLAILGLVLLGLVWWLAESLNQSSPLLLCIPLFGLLGALTAILLGSLALGSIRHNRHKGSAFAAGGVLLGVGDLVGLVVLFAWAFTGTPQSQLLNLQPDLTALDDLDPKINRAMRANVFIESRHGLGRIGTGAVGSGVILALDKNEAVILTNRHVVDSSFVSKPGGQPKADTLSVLLLGALPQTGRVVWFAPDGIDAAVVRVDCTTTKALAAKWHPGRRTRIGDRVFAIGNPQQLNWSYTEGAVSQFRIQDAGGHRVRIIQTQTAINPGNSGGGLYDSEGYLIGINTWTHDRRVSEGLNFAIGLDAVVALFPADLDLHPNKDD